MRGGGSIVAGILLCLGPSTGTLSHAEEIPTGGSPSPLFGAKEFTVPMLLLEELGNQPFATEGALVPLPPPTECDGFPNPEALDAFLSRPTVSPPPMRQSNDKLPNSWDPVIRRCVPSVTRTVLEGRPPGEFFAHQRFEQFPIREFVQTATTGARVNNGIRDRLQRHHFAVGEFAPGGLYHRRGTNRGTEPQFHPNTPDQNPLNVWTWDGTLPGKLIQARYGVPMLFRHYNALPIDVSANGGFGIHQLSTHLHNGHNGGESDGFAHAFFFPGEFYDYHWPMILAGNDTINVGATDPRAGGPDDAGGIIRIPGDWRETMSTLWFHDHRLDFTAPNAYKGQAAMLNIYSAVDRGREPRTDEEAQGGGPPGYACHYANPNHPNLCLPSGSGLDWGNRDYDVNLMLSDKAWDKDGQFFFNPFNTDGFLGDRVLANHQWKPFFEVRARRYRFRILSTSVSRFFKIALVDERGNRVPFHMVANDGNLMEHAVAFPNAESKDLPELGISERYDIVIDFARFRPGSKLYFVNIMQHRSGRRPQKELDLKDALIGNSRDPAVGKFLEFRVVPMAPGQIDRSMNPVDYEVGKKIMIPVPRLSEEELRTAKHRTFNFGRAGRSTDANPWTIRTDGGKGFPADPHRLSAAPDRGTAEIWHIINSGNGWSHPVHIHFEEGQILTRDRRPTFIWEQFARKDVYRIGGTPDSSKRIDVALRFRDFLGTYMEHCHNTQHEDKAMLLRWDVQNPGQAIAIPTPIPTWEGVFYEDTFTLPTYKTGDPRRNPGLSLLNGRSGE